MLNQKKTCESHRLRPLDRDNNVDHLPPDQLLLGYNLCNFLDSFELFPPIYIYIGHKKKHACKIISNYCMGVIMD